jgi:TRAP-type uncharacterized transport system substrate-binding protein
MMRSHLADNVPAMTVSGTRSAGRVRKAGAFAGTQIRPGRTGRMGGLAIAGFFVLAACPAFAEKAPTGMVPYTHPVYKNGHRILWHGAWRAGGAKASASSRERGKAAEAPVAVAPAAPAPAVPPPAPLAVAPNHEFTILADFEDSCASRMAGDLVAALKSAGFKARSVIGQTSPDGLARAISGNTADLAIVPMGALLSEDEAGPVWKDRAPYVARLANETVEIIAAKSVSDLSQLNGRKVSYGPVDSADGATAEALFSRLGVSPKPIREPLPGSLADLAAGKIDAVVIAGASDSKAVADFGKDGRFHVVAVPWSPALRGAYAPARLTAQDRPNLIGATEKVDVVAAPMALLAINAPSDSPRAAQLTPAVKTFFEKFKALLAPNTEASWRQVNLAATANWPRLPAAQEWIANNRGEVDASFEKYRSIAHSVASASEAPGAAEADRLYQSLMQWRGVGQ